MMEWEFHTPPQANFQIDLEGAVKAARDAGAENLMFYTQSHWGYALYPSDSAVRQPNLDYDLFGTEVSLARKYGISSTAYYSLQFNNQCVLTHPDWAWVNEAGEKQTVALVYHLPGFSVSPVCLEDDGRNLRTIRGCRNSFSTSLEFSSSSFTRAGGVPSASANIPRRPGIKIIQAIRIAKGSRLARAGIAAFNGIKSGP